MAEMTIPAALALAFTHQRAGRWNEAESLYRQILSFEPDDVVALQMLGQIVFRRGDSASALDLMQRAMRVAPPTASQYITLGVILGTLRRWEEAVKAYRDALSIDPKSAEAQNNLGIVLAEQGKFSEAIDSYRSAIALRAAFPEAHNNLANALRETGDLDEAIEGFKKAIALKPQYPEAHNNLGLAFQQKGNLDAAIDSFARAIALRPNFAEVHGNLGIALRLRGDLDRAIASLRHAVALKPDPLLASKLLFALHFDPAATRQSLFEEHVDWNRRYAQPLAHRIPPPENDRSPDRPLRIGYVCPNLAVHPVARFLLPLLKQHDAGQFEVFCYTRGGAWQSLIQEVGDHVHAWRDFASSSADQIARAVRDDRIDILVDLVMHTDAEAMLAFAQKPAPVQVTYLAYCSTTGLQTIDYRLTDRFFDPSEEEDRCYSERSIRLTSYWCYEPSHFAGAASGLPSLKTEHITFGCLNNFAKVSAPALSAWREILQAVPQSRLLLHMLEGVHQDRLREYFASGGIAASRIRFTGFKPPGEYFQQYRTIDIALDPFPFTGGTTTCDALWMGVPVVSLAGKTAVWRGGLSILGTIGHAELVAANTAEYVEIARSLASDIPRLVELRRTLRAQMRLSALMDAPSAARQIEAAYRQIWRAWCEGSAGA